MGLFARTSQLVMFTRGAQVWRYTLDDRAVTYQAQTFETLAGLKLGKINDGSSPDNSGLEITLPVTAPIVGLFIPVPLTERITVTLLHLKQGDALAKVRFTGAIGGVKLTSLSTAVLSCRNPGVDFSTNALTRCWQAGCPHDVYGVGLGECNADPEAMRINGAITYSSGVTLKAAEWAAKPDGWFNGGFIRWQIGLATELRWIVSHVGETLTLLTPATVPVGTSVPAYPGCDQTDGANGCLKFNNLPNYGGQKFIPQKNPMGGDTIY